ncbi:hypothetical protein GPALN_010767 [Globodera pallida]|nr:hypothetical protein GPALN_010767 [Globodera pallida]
MPRVQISKRQKGASDSHRRAGAGAVAIHETAHSVLLWRHPHNVDVFRHVRMFLRMDDRAIWILDNDSAKRVVYTRPQLKAKLMMVLEGWAAEELYCGVSIGHEGGDVETRRT